MNVIGENIKKLRKAKGMTQEGLAEAVNVSFQAVSKWENGGSPDLEMLPILASKYGVTVNYCHDRKVPDSRGRILCGHTLEDGERIVVVDDLINSGKTIVERIERLKEIADGKVAAVVAVVDRYEMDMESVHGTGAKRWAEKYGAKILTVVSGDDITRAIRQGIV